VFAVTIDPEPPCIFCALQEESLAANELAFALEDKFPVSPGHSLVIPRRHILTLDEASEREIAALFALVREVKDQIRRRYGAGGFNIGINEGAVAGQTVMHLHIHVIPRRHGDVDDPRGGVRKVLPGRGRGRL
jgi:diadenosine tetraphosphate (Ap4A) HIT family hydrolase